MSLCPEALHGRHGEVDRNGRCPWCRRKVGARMPRNWNEIRKANIAAQDPLSIEPDPDEEYWGN